MNSKKISKIVLTFLIIILTIVILKYLPHDKIKQIIDKSGDLGAIVYILLFTFLPIFFFPVPVLALVGGISFGLIKGSIYTVIGASLNCIIMFYISRYIFRDLIANMIKNKEKPIMDNYGLNKSVKEFLMVFTLRLIPLFPYNIINYTCGLSKIRFKNYFIASFLGIIPGTLIFVNIGDKSANIKSLDFVIASILLILLILISAILILYYKNKNNK